MKIRSQNLLITLPIFAALGLAAALLYRDVQQRELHWGLEERARGTVASLAAFIGDALGEGAAPGAPGTRLDRVVLRGSELSLFTNLVVHGFRADGIAETRFRWPAGAAPVAGPEESRRLLGDADYRLTPLREISGVLCQPAFGRAADDLVLAVAIPVPGYPAELALIDRDAVLLFLFALASGFLLVLLPSRLLSRGLARLGKQTASTAGPAPVQPLVREFADLGQALEAMVAIRDATIARARRGLVEHEQFRRNEDLVDTLASFGQPAHGCRSGSVSALVRTIGIPRAGHFLRAVAVPDGVVFCSGMIECRDPREAGELAIAAGELAVTLLAREQPGDAARELAALFPVTGLGMLAIDSSGTVHQHAPGHRADDLPDLQPGQALVLASVPLAASTRERLAGLADPEILALLHAGLADRRAGLAVGIARLDNGRSVP